MAHTEKGNQDVGPTGISTEVLHERPRLRDQQKKALLNVLRGLPPAAAFEEIAKEAKQQGFELSVTEKDVQGKTQYCLDLKFPAIQNGNGGRLTIGSGYFESEELAEQNALRWLKEKLRDESV